MSEDTGPTAVAGSSPASTTTHQPPPQQHHQQHQPSPPQQHSQAPPPPLSQPQMPPHQSAPQRLSVHDIRNSDLVSRLLAATPPYLYSSPVGPQTFFFSDMLRSLVQNKHAEQAAKAAAAAASSSSSAPGISAGLLHASAAAAAAGRRPRKRSWGQARGMPSTGHGGPGLFDMAAPKMLNHNNNELPEKTLFEKPLELTNKCGSPALIKYAAQPPFLPEVPEKMMRSMSHHSMQSNKMAEMKLLPPTSAASDYSASTACTSASLSLVTPSTTSSTPGSSGPGGELVLPPPPPMWYPPLYPPYGIDPLHFFIDLRVSGHIYDRKKENTSPNAADPLTAGGSPPSTAPGKPRFGSAFSVPQSRREKSPSSRALNLTASPSAPQMADSKALAPVYPTSNHSAYDHSTPLLDVVALKEAACKSNAQYVLQNLPRIYTDLTTQMGGGGGGAQDERNSTNSDETVDSKSDGEGQEMGGGGAAGQGTRDGGNVELEDHDEDSGDVVIVDGGKQHDDY